MKTPNEKMEEVMQNLGKQPGRISAMIPVSKIWRWIKKKTVKGEK